VMKRMMLEVPLCDAHRKRRMTLLTAGWILLAGCIPMGVIIGSMGSGDDLVGVGVLVGFGAFIVSLVLLAMGSRIIWPKLIDDHQAIFRGVSPAFLDRVALQPAAVAAASR